MSGGVGGGKGNRRHGVYRVQRDQLIENAVTARGQRKVKIKNFRPERKKYRRSRKGLNRMREGLPYVATCILGKSDRGSQGRASDKLYTSVGDLPGTPSESPGARPGKPATRVSLYVAMGWLGEQGETRTGRLQAELDPPKRGRKVEEAEKRRLCHGRSCTAVGSGG